MCHALRVRADLPRLTGEEGRMLGFKSLEAKLRDGNGRAAPATVLGIEKGRSLNWKSETGPHGSGNYVEEGTVSNDRYRLQVQPDGEPAFEAVVKIREDEFFGLYALRVGSAVTVLFDPEDHQKVAVDVAATKAQMRSHVKTVSIAAEGIGQLASQFDAAPSAPDPVARLKELADLRDRGALSDAEFESMKAKLLND
jgi:hypothetical protein